MPLPAQLISQHPGLSESQAGLLSACFELYKAKGLYEGTYGGDEKALCDLCLRRDECWPPDFLATDQGTNNGVISLPHVGRDYAASGAGVAVLGINFNDYNGLTAAIGMAEWEAGAFRAGKKKLDFDSPGYAGSMFQFGSATSAATVLRALDGAREEDEPTGEVLALTLDRIARLQAVKCSPGNDSGKPSAAMSRNCPPLILDDELDVLRPGHVLSFGDVAFDAALLLGGAVVDTWDRPLRRAHLERRWGRVEVWGLYHPRNLGLWRQSQDALRHALTDLER